MPRDPSPLEAVPAPTWPRWVFWGIWEGTKIVCIYIIIYIYFIYRYMYVYILYTYSICICSYIHDVCICKQSSICMGIYIVIPTHTYIIAYGKYEKQSLEARHSKLFRSLQKTSTVFVFALAYGCAEWSRFVHGFQARWQKSTSCFSPQVVKNKTTCRLLVATATP